METNVESIVFLKRIETIRRYYATLDPAAARFFATPEGTASTAALASIGMRASLAEMLFTSASMIAAVISILAGVGAALPLAFRSRRRSRSPWSWHSRSSACTWCGCIAGVGL